MAITASGTPPWMRRIAIPYRNAFKYRRALPLRLLHDVWRTVIRPSRERLAPDANEDPYPGRWYHVGADRMRVMVAEAGLELISADIDIVFRDPIAHFVKP
jgi:hypothetical protein